MRFLELWEMGTNNPGNFARYGNDRMLFTKRRGGLGEGAQINAGYVIAIGNDGNVEVAITSPAITMSVVLLTSLLLVRKDAVYTSSATSVSLRGYQSRKKAPRRGVSTLVPRSCS